MSAAGPSQGAKAPSGGSAVHEVTSVGAIPRPFKVLGIQQIAIGGPDKQRLRTLWVDMLGLEVTGNFVSERENVDEDICAIGSGPFKVEVDLMQPLDPFEIVRVIAAARITMPASRVRLSAGRRELGEGIQALCFMAGANSIFYGDKLLVTGNPDVVDDRALLKRLDLPVTGALTAEVS